MMSQLKKSLAVAGVVALTGAQVLPVLVNAGGLNGNTLTVTTSGEDVVITSSATPFTVGATVSANVNGVSRTATVTSSGVITIADVDGNAGGTVDPANYVIAVTEDAGTPGNAADDVFFTVVYNTLTAGTAGSNKIQVSAQVVPSLSLTIGNGTDGNQAISFGTLTPGTFSEDDISLTYASNAINGVTVTMTSAGLKDAAINREIGVNNIASETNTAASDYYKVSTLSGGTALVAFDTATDTIGNAAGAQMLATQTVATSSAPTATTTQLVTVGAQAASDTEAGTYTDTLTFTITGSF